jgi:hypothetical protein
MPFKSSTEAKARAHRSWAFTPDRSKRTAPARAAQYARDEKLVDPDGAMKPADRARAVENLRKSPPARDVGERCCRTQG